MLWAQCASRRSKAGAKASSSCKDTAFGEGQEGQGKQWRRGGCEECRAWEAEGRSWASALRAGGATRSFDRGLLRPDLTCEQDHAGLCVQEACSGAGREQRGKVGGRADTQAGEGPAQTGAEAGQMERPQGFSRCSGGRACRAAAEWPGVRLGQGGLVREGSLRSPEG